MWSLLTQRCYLRDYGEEDREDFVRINTDLVAREHLNGPLSLEEAQQLFETSLSDTDPYQGTRWAVFDRKSNEYLGHVFLIPWDERRDEMEWGIILEPKHWGRGLGSEIGRATLEECFLRRGLRRLWATIDVGHATAIRLHEQLGFVHVGRGEDEDGTYDLYAAESPTAKEAPPRRFSVPGATPRP